MVFENGRKVLYVQVLRALYGMLIAALLWYKKFRSELESVGFEFNNYDACVGNRIVKGKQQTVRFHVDDLMSSHVDSKVNDEFLKWLNEMYGEHGEVTATRGKVHDYLGMVLDFRTKGKMIVDMSKYSRKMWRDFEEKYGKLGTAKTIAKEGVFAPSEGEVLSKEMAEDYHHFVARGLFSATRGRPDEQTVISAMAGRVKEPRQSDWDMLLHFMRFLKATWEDVLTLSADNLHVIKWYVDASFAVHPDFRSHSGGVMTMGEGAIQSMCQKQKLNTQSACTVELVSADDASSGILWTKLFMEDQGYEIEQNILYQDNKSTILLLENGKKSSGKRTRAINIRYFFLTDQVQKGNLTVRYCPTDLMLGDYMTKATQGKKFDELRRAIMGMQ